MIVKNNKPVGRWFFYKVNGVVAKNYIAGYSEMEIAGLTNENQIIYNGHDKALRNVEDKFGKSFTNSWAVPSDPASEFKNYYISATTVSSTGGTISPSGATVSVPEGENKAFSLISETNYYLTGVTIDGGVNNQISAVTGLISGTSTYTFTDVMDSTHVIAVGYAAYGA